jgi:hypothetical protein
MPGCGKRGNPRPGFPRFPPPLEIAPRSPLSHRAGCGPFFSRKRTRKKHGKEPGQRARLISSLQAHSWIRKCCPLASLPSARRPPLASESPQLGTRQRIHQRRINECEYHRVGTDPRREDRPAIAVKPRFLTKKCKRCSQGAGPRERRQFRARTVTQVREQCLPRFLSG